MEARFKWMWADHGDDISRQYAGTGALKSGFTRTGVPAGLHTARCQGVKHQGMKQLLSKTAKLAMARSCICTRSSCLHSDKMLCCFVEVTLQMCVTGWQGSGRMAA